MFEILKRFFYKISKKQKLLDEPKTKEKNTNVYVDLINIMQSCDNYKKYEKSRINLTKVKNEMEELIEKACNSWHKKESVI